MAKPGVMIYFDIRPCLKRLSIKEKALLFEAILDYGEYGSEPDFEGAVGVAWDFIKPGIDRDSVRYGNQVLQKQYATYVREVKKKGLSPISFDDWKVIPDNERNRLIPADIERYPTPTTTPTTTTTTATTTATTIESKADKPPTRPPIDYESVKKLYNQCCPSLPSCTKLNDQRKKAIKARFNEGCTIADFEAAFTKAEASPFLTGKKTQGWRASFDWLIKSSNMMKVLEGNYDEGDNKYGETEHKPLWTVGTTV